jgi:hypothetical protein
MRRSLLLLVAPLLLCVAAPAGAQDHGLRVVAVEQLPAPGTARVRVEVVDKTLDAAMGATPSGGDLRVKLEDGEARLSSARRAKDLGLRTHTVVAIDHSGSFKKWGWEKPAWQFADAVAQSLSQGDTLSLQLFSETVKAFPAQSSAADFATDLTAAKAAPWGVITRLNSSLIQAIDEAAQANPNGFNRIYVLTDGDEESATYSWEDVAKAAAARGVQVSVVIYPPDMARLGKEALKKLPTLLDNLRALAGATGGLVHEHDAGTAKATLGKAREWNERSRNFVALQARVCGMNRTSADNRVFVDYVAGGSRTAWSDGFKFVEWGSPELYASCDPQKAGDPPPAKTDPVVPWWVWAIVAALTFLLILALIMRSRQDKTKVVVQPPPAPPPAAPVGEPKPAVAEQKPVEPQARPPQGERKIEGLDWELPRTFLEVSGDGSWSKDPRYAIFKRDFRIGADSSRDLDLVVKNGKVSGHHCTVQVFPRGDIWVRDESSTNGTFVDGERLPEGGKRAAQVGSEVRLGSEISFKIARPGAPGSTDRRTRLDDGDSSPSPPSRPTPRAPKKTRIAGAGAAPSDPSSAAPAPADAKKPRRRRSKKTRIIE